MLILKTLYLYWLILEICSNTRQVLMASKLPCNFSSTEIKVITTKPLCVLHIDNSDVINKKTLRRQHFRWLKMDDDDIGSHLNSCKMCQSNRIVPALGPFYLQKWASKSHETDSIDFAGKRKTSLFYCY